VGDRERIDQLVEIEQRFDLGTRDRDQEPAPCQYTQGR
jgi:hypothetical protein